MECNPACETGEWNLNNNEEGANIMEFQKFDEQEKEIKHDCLKHPHNGDSDVSESNDPNVFQI
ncbi:hypothetical protein WKT22_03469 [Candidatus Lokiarchaeum ossiferum]